MFFGIVGEKRLGGQPFSMMVRINYYPLNEIRLDLDLDKYLVGYKKKLSFTTNNINILVFHTPHML